MCKKLLFLFCSVLLCAGLVLGAAAATVYVSEDANGTGESVESPVGSLSRALDVLGQQGGTVVLLNAVHVPADLTVYEQTGDLTITAEGSGRLVMTGDILTFAKNCNDNLITIDTPLTTGEDGIVLFGGFNSIHFTKNFAVDGFVSFYGGVQAPLASTADSYEVNPDENLAVLTDLPYSITVDNGTFRIFQGGNYRYTTSCLIGSIAAELTVTINGGTFTRAVH